MLSLGRILPLLVFSVAGFAGSITNVGLYRLSSGGPGTGLPEIFGAPNSSITVSGLKNSPFKYSGDVYLLGGGQPIVAGQDFSGPLELRFSNATINCLSLSPCSGNILIHAYLTNGGVDSAGPFLPVNGGLEGTSDGLKGSFMSYNISVSRGTETSVLSAQNLSITPTFSYLENGVDIKYATNMSITMAFNVGIMSSNSSISLPDSLFVALGDPTTATPEPGTLLILGASLAGYAWFRKR